jgi:hypothetical protein
VKWRPSGKQYSAAVGTLILVSQAFSDRPEKPTLILAALGLFIGTPAVMKLDEVLQRRSNGEGEKK